MLTPLLAETVLEMEVCGGVLQPLHPSQPSRTGAMRVLGRCPVRAEPQLALTERLVLCFPTLLAGRPEKNISFGTGRALA